MNTVDAIPCILVKTFQDTFQFRSQEGVRVKSMLAVGREIPQGPLSVPGLRVENYRSERSVRAFWSIWVICGHVNLCLKIHMVPRMMGSIEVAENSKTYF